MNALWRPFALWREWMYLGRFNTSKAHAFAPLQGEESYHRAIGRPHAPWATTVAKASSTGMPAIISSTIVSRCFRIAGGNCALFS